MLLIRSDRSWGIEPCDSVSFPARSGRVAVLFDESSFCPVKGSVFTPFGPAGELQHSGVDIAVAKGTPVRAAFDGIVSFSTDDNSAYGSVIRIAHRDGIETVYSNLSGRSVQEGDKVHAGDVIARTDSLDGAGPHLHFELRFRDLAIDPARAFDFPSGQLRSPLYIMDFSHLPEAASCSSASVGEQREIYQLQLARIAEQKRIAQEEAARLARLEAAARKYHTVRSGDTLSRIAAKYHTSVKSICRLNGIKETTTLSIGRKLRVK
jgi:murein DD-endopeptidase MepM/ murein hydrolase activator NlpD